MTVLRRRVANGEQAPLHALVLAGGSGRRLEPFVRRQFGAAVPKQFCTFFGRRSLLQQTVDRIAPLVHGPRLTVVVDRSQADRARGQLAESPGVRIVEQPCDRGTAAGVLLPLLRIVQESPDAAVVLLASDHGVADARAFRRSIAAAHAALRNAADSIVLLGATPDAPTTDYGWIVREPASDGPGASHRPDRVVRFVEKPQADEATRLLRSGRALWNTMVLVARASALLENFAARLGPLTDALRGLVARSSGPPALEDYAALPHANFSADLLGAADGLSVLALPVATGWTDLGTEPRLMEWLRRTGAPLNARSAPVAPVAAPAPETVTPRFA